MKKHLLLLGALIFLLSACGGGQSADISTDVSGDQSLVSLDTSVPASEDIKPDVSPITDRSQTVSSSQPADNSGEASQSEGAADRPVPEPGSAAQPSHPDSASVSKPKDRTQPAQDKKPTPPVQSPQTEIEPDSGAEPDTQPEPPKGDKETALAYIGRSVSSLISAIGEPKGRDYAPSCLGDGEDGELFYDGFTVYTYRVNGEEIVQDII